jgi:uncharacterized membrane protein
MRLNQRGFVIELAIFCIVALVVTAWFLVSMNAETRQIVAANIDFSNPFIVVFVILFLCGVIGGYFIERERRGEGK